MTRRSSCGTWRRGQPLGEPLTGHTDWVYSVAFSPDGKTLASGSDDKTIILWDVATRPARSASRSPATPARCLSVAFSPDGKTLASGSADRTHHPVGRGDAASALGEPSRATPAAVMSVAFSPDGKTLASGSCDKTIILWDVATRPAAGRAAHRPHRAGWTAWPSARTARPWPRAVGTRRIIAVGRGDRGTPLGRAAHWPHQRRC